MGNLCVAGPWDSLMGVRIPRQFLMHNGCRELENAPVALGRERAFLLKSLSLTGVSVIQLAEFDWLSKIDCRPPMKFRR